MEEPRDQVKGGSGHCFCPGSVAAAPPRISEERPRPEDGSKSNVGMKTKLTGNAINTLSDLIFL